MVGKGGTTSTKTTKAVKPLKLPVQTKSPSVASPASVPIPIRYQISKLDWPFPDFRKPHLLWRLKSTVAVFLVGCWGKSILTLMNTTKVLNKEALVSAIFNRPLTQPLITVSNHESCLDDPALIALLMTNAQLLKQDKMRWGLAAHDVCFQNPVHTAFFSLGKCIPVVRGLGVYQKAIDFAIERLNEGKWLHVFPEGRVNMERRELYRLKWGIGRIVAECKTPPLIVPFWHSGMSDVLPNDKPYIPRWGYQVLVNVGEPIDVSEVLNRVRDKTGRERRKAVTDYIQAEMCVLREKTLKIKEKLKENQTLSL